MAKKLTYPFNTKIAAFSPYLGSSCIGLYFLPNFQSHHQKTELSKSQGGVLLRTPFSMKTRETRLTFLPKYTNSLF